MSNQPQRERVRDFKWLLTRWIKKPPSAPLAPTGWAEPADHGDTRHKTLKSEHPRV